MTKLSQRPKAFISYCAHDGPLAKRLYGDLHSLGCDAWQYEASAVVGSDAWTNILETIRACDVFIVILSQDSLRSKGVKEEIDYAHFQALNYERPLLVPLAIDRTVTIPDKLIKIVPLYFDVEDYEAGLEKLLPALQLTGSPFATTLLEDASFTRKKEFDAGYEVAIFATNLITNHPAICAEFNKICAPVKNAQGGHFRVWPAQAMLWKSSNFREHKPNGWYRRGGSDWYVVFPLNWGMSNGHGTEKRVIVKIAAEFVKDFGDVHQPRLETNTLRLVFKGFQTFAISDQSADAASSGDETAL